MNFLLLGSERLLWCAHLRAAGQPWQVCAHQLDRKGRQRLRQHLPCLSVLSRFLLVVLVHTDRKFIHNNAFLLPYTC